MAFAIMRHDKLRTPGQIGALGRHNERTRETPNADPDRLGANVRLVGSGDWLADAQARLDEVRGHIRSNAVLALEYVFTASPAWFERAQQTERAEGGAQGDQGDQGDQGAHDVLREWIGRSMAWLEELYGARNIVAAVVHQDEHTPHLQALVVPVRENGRLSAHHFVGGDRTRMVQLQDSYAAAVRDLGLERGVRGSPARHQAVRDWYAKLEQPLRAAAAVAREISVEPPARVTLNPEAWAERQQERIAAVVAPAVDQAVTQAQHHAFRADRAEAAVQVLSARVAQLEHTNQRLEQERSALRSRVARYEQAEVERARSVDLPAVLERLGGQRDPADMHQWKLNGERINITGTKFYNHDQGRGGGGAIDLVMQATGYTFREAVAWLGAEVGREAAEQAGLEALRADLRAAAAAPRPAFAPPAAVEERWSQVRAYLVQERGLPEALVERVHAAGDVYASERGGHTNAVFLSRAPDGTPTGAFVRGVEPGSSYRGLAAGSERAAGVFAVDDPGAGERAALPQQLLITEAPIDALSACALRSRVDDRPPARFISTDGAGPVPHEAIRQTQEAGGRLVVATDNDHAGDQLFERIWALYPQAERYRPALKDLNEDLTHPEAAQARTEQVLEQEREHAAVLRRLAGLGSWGAPAAREAYDLYRQARLAGHDERAALEHAAVELARRHNGMGAQTLSGLLAPSLPRGDSGAGRTEEEAQRAAQDAIKAALAREDVRQYRAGRDRGR